MESGCFACPSRYVCIFSTRHIAVCASEFWQTTGRNLQHWSLVSEKDWSVLGFAFLLRWSFKIPLGLADHWIFRGFISLFSLILITMSEALVAASFHLKAPLSAHLSPIHPSHPSSFIFTFIFRIFLLYPFGKMRGVGYWLLGDQPGSQGDSVVSLTTRLGQPQMNKPPVSCGRGRGASPGSAECVCRGVGVGLGSREEGCRSSERTLPFGLP